MISFRRHGRDQHGSASVELAVLIPSLILMLGMIIAGGRIWFARTTVVEAAQTAARAASLQRSAGSAQTAGREAGNRSMATSGLHCSSSSITVDTGGFGIPVGNPATIDAAIACTVRLDDLGLRFLPGTVDLTGRGSTALDTYRAR